MKPTTLKQLLADGFQVGSQRRVIRIWHKIEARDRTLGLSTAAVKSGGKAL